MLPLASLGREIDPLFGRLLDGLWNDGDGSGDPLRLEVRETDEHYLVRAEIPGLDPKDLDVQLQGDVLVISGEKRAETRDERETWAYSERAYGSFRRAVRLPMPVDPERVQAEHKNGVVTIRLEKSAAARPKRIQVNGA
jgi:HSP20 family protein